MNRISTVIASILLVGVALLHLIWAVGILWPASTVEEYKATFWGDPSPMPPLWTGAILSVLLLFGAWVLISVVWQKKLPGPAWIWKIIVGGMVFVFLTRGIMGYLPAEDHSLQPFASNNLYIYSPLCLVLAVTIAIGGFYKPGKFQKKVETEVFSEDSGA